MANWNDLVTRANQVSVMPGTPPDLSAEEEYYKLLQMAKELYQQYGGEDVILPSQYSSKPIGWNPSKFQAAADILKQKIPYYQQLANIKQYRGY